LISPDVPRRRWLPLVLLSACLLLVACSGDDGSSGTPGPLPPPEELEGTCWLLTAMNDAGGGTAYPVDLGDLTCLSQVCFDAGGSLRARADCNGCTGTWTGGSSGALDLVLAQCGSLPCLPECPPYHEFLESTQGYEIQGMQLRLFGEVAGESITAVHELL